MLKNLFLSTILLFSSISLVEAHTTYSAGYDQTFEILIDDNWILANEDSTQFIYANNDLISLSINDYGDIKENEDLSDLALQWVKLLNGQTLEIPMLSFNLQTDALDGMFPNANVEVEFYDSDVSKINFDDLKILQVTVNGFDLVISADEVEFYLDIKQKVVTSYFIVNNRLYSIEIVSPLKLKCEFDVREHIEFIFNSNTLLNQ